MNAQLRKALRSLFAACEEIRKQANMGIDEANPNDWEVAEITRPAIEGLAAALLRASCFFDLHEAERERAEQRKGLKP